MVEADAVFTRLDEVAREAYGLRLESPDVRRATTTGSLAEHIAAYPAWLGCGLYFVGMLLANHRGDLRGKLRAFEASVSLLRHEIRLAPTLAQERGALLPHAEFHFRQALIHNLRYETTPALDPGAPETLRQRFAEEMETLLKETASKKPGSEPKSEP
jgi:hypothetical protein